MKEAAKTIQDVRRAEDGWVESIIDWISQQPKEERQFLTSRQVFVYALNGTALYFNNAHGRKIANCMKALGYIPGFRRVKGENRTQRGYVPGIAPKDEPGADGKEKARGLFEGLI